MGGEGLLLDDGGNVRTGIGAGAGAQDPTVAGGVGRDGGEDGHGGALGEVGLADGADGLGADERDVAGEDEQVFRKRLAREVEPGFEHL